MIKSIRIKNFESHEDTFIELVDGFNLMVGESNSGKSSIVRAIALVVDNRFDRDCVRIGSSFCEVTITSDKGSVTAQRGESKNNWIIRLSDGTIREYKNIGTSVPPDVLEVLGMGVRTHGDIKELANIMFQLDKHYMISEIDGKKTTSNMIARMMDEAIGIGGMEELIKDMATDFQSFKRELSSCSGDLKKLKDEIMPEEDFETRKNLVASIREQLKKIDQLEDQVGRSTELQKRVCKIKSRLFALETRRGLLLDLESSWSSIEELACRYALLKSAASKSCKIEALGESMTKTEELEALHSRAESILGRLKLLDSASSIKSKLDRLLIPDLDFGDLLRRIEGMESIHGKIERAKSILNKARITYRKISSLGKTLADASNEMIRREEELENLKEEAGECPLCGSPLRSKED